jgi:hypothetical protein
MALGRPAITTPNRLDLRAVQDAIGNTRQRIEAIEAQIANATSSASTSSSTSSTVLSTLRAQLAALTIRVTALEGYFADLTSDGIAVWTGSSFIARTLVGAGGIVVIDGTGVAGNPTIAGAGSDELALDNEGRVGLTTDGGAVFMSSGA